MPLEYYNVEITGISAEGKAVGRAEDIVVFIPFGAPGDVVDVRVVKKKRRFLEGKIINIHSASPMRSTPFCEHFGICGGCKWQHINYDAQLKLKHDQIVDTIKKIAKTEPVETLDIIGSENIRMYRNKLEYSFSCHRWLTKDEIDSEVDLNTNAAGFHIPGFFDKIIDINKCWLQNDISNRIRIEAKQYSLSNDLSFYSSRNKTGFIRGLIVRTATTGNVMIIAVFGDDDEKKIKMFLENLKNKFPEITSLNYVVNEKMNDSFDGLHSVCFSGEDHIMEKIGEVMYKISPLSFFQTNTLQAKELYDVVNEFAGLSGEEIVYDLYTGTGTIACYIARNAKKVVGIELNADAIVDAENNSSLNNISNTVFLSGDIRTTLTPELFSKYGNPDVIITDPPRSGMHADVVSKIMDAAPQKIVYVSCNPSTQARDIEILKINYRLKAIRPVDMFPHTQHVENVALLERL